MRALTLVGCWAHCRRYFFEAAICKYKTGADGLRLIAEIYAADATLSKLPPSARKKERHRLIEPLLRGFFAWVNARLADEKGRSLATRALGYARNQKEELLRVLEDGRIPLDNTRSERSLRTIVVGRKNWLFYGSDTHAEAAAAIFSIIASCRLHGLDPTAYLDEVIRVLPFWPSHRYLELTPLRWRDTRARLSSRELDIPVGTITVPEPLPPT